MCLANAFGLYCSILCFYVSKTVNIFTCDSAHFCKLSSQKIHEIKPADQRFTLVSHLLTVSILLAHFLKFLLIIY